MRTVHVAIVLLGVLVLAGCQPTVETPPSVPSAPSFAPSPSASPEQQRETGLAQPKQVFGGDCSAVLDEAVASSIVGTPLTLLTPSTEPRELSPVFTFVEQAGGLECAWGSGDPYRGIQVAIAPEGAATFKKATGCFSVDGESRACSLDSTSNGTRLSGIVRSLDASDADLRQVADALIAVFEENAMLVPAVPVPLYSVGAWKSPVDCDAIVASIDFDALLGGGPYKGGFAGGNDNYFTPLDQSLRENTTAYCGVYDGSESPGFYFGALGGARWNEQKVAAVPGATEVIVPGLDLVILRPAYGSFYIDVFQGPNWFNTYSDDPESVYPVILEIVEYLDAAAD